MPKIRLTQPHGLAAPEVYRLLDVHLRPELKDRFGIGCTWISDTVADLGRAGVVGTLTIEAERVLVDLDLSFALTPLQATIEVRLRALLQVALGPAAPAPGTK